MKKSEINNQNLFDAFFNDVRLTGFDFDETTGKQVKFTFEVYFFFNDVSTSVGEGLNFLQNLKDSQKFKEIALGKFKTLWIDNAGLPLRAEDIEYIQQYNVSEINVDSNTLTVSDIEFVPEYNAVRAVFDFSVNQEEIDQIDYNKSTEGLNSKLSLDEKIEKLNMLIDLALQSGDKEWFNELTEELNKLKK